MTHGKSVVVPVEPTRDMLNAAIDVDSFKLGDISPLGFRISPQMLFEKCWSAMLAATPAPSSLAGGEVGARGIAKRLLSTNFDFLHPKMEPSEQLEFEDSITNAILAALSPEAREGEAVAWLYETVSGTKTASVEPLSRINGDKVYGTALYTHPAAPSADKLRTALSEIRDGMVASRDCISVDDWIELADEALSTPDALKGDAKP